MTSRELTIDDLDAVVKWHQEHYSGLELPELSKSIGSAMVEDEYSSIGFGTLVLIPEATMFLDRARSRRDLVQALEVLMQQARARVAREGYNKFIVFSPDEAYAKLLEKHFGAKRLKEIPLIIGA